MVECDYVFYGVIFSNLLLYLKQDGTTSQIYVNGNLTVEESGMQNGIYQQRVFVLESKPITKTKIEES